MFTKILQIESLVDAIAVRYALPTISEAPLPDMLRAAPLDPKWQARLMDLVGANPQREAQEPKPVVLGDRTWYRRNWRLFGDKSTDKEKREISQQA